MCRLLPISSVTQLLSQDFCVARNQDMVLILPSKRSRHDASSCPFQPVSVSNFQFATGRMPTNYTNGCQIQAAKFFKVLEPSRSLSVDVVCGILSIWSAEF